MNFVLRNSMTSQILMLKIAQNWEKFFPFNLNIFQLTRLNCVLVVFMAL